MFDITVLWSVNYNGMQPGLVNDFEISKTPILFNPVRFNKVWYGILEFNVPLDTV